MQDFEGWYPMDGKMVFFSPDDRWMYFVYDGDNQAETSMVISFAVDPATSRITRFTEVLSKVWQNELGDQPWLNAFTSSISPDGRFLVIPFRRVRERYSVLGVIRLDGGYMTPLPIQESTRFDNYFNASGVAVFNTNATAPGWAGYE